jgi:hypothetical protein
MPRTSPTTQAVNAVGATLTMGTPDALGDIVEVGDAIMLIVRNGSGSSINVTLQTPATYEGLAVAENVQAVAAGAIAAFRLPARLYGRPGSGADPGKAYVDYSAVATVTRAVVSLS